MAPTEITSPPAWQSTPPSSTNHSSSEPKSSKDDDKPRGAQTEQLTDPSTARNLQWAIKGSNELTDPATEEILRGAT